MFARSARRPRLRPLSGFVLAVVLAAVLGLVLPPKPAAAAAILQLKVELAPGVTLPIEAGQPFRMRLTYECSSSLAGDTCTNLVVSSTLPPSLEGLSVSGNTDVQLSSYDVGTRTATWTLNSPLPLGTTGQLEFEARFIPGTTVDGTTADVPATITADNATPTTSTLPGITADATDQSTVAKVLESGGAVGDVSNYRIDVCPGLTGALNFTNVTITDTLPLGATYVSSTPPATSVDTSSSPQVVVWSGIPSIDVPSCRSFRVTAAFSEADASNVLGASKTNGVGVTGTPYGGVVKTMTTSVSHVLAAPGPGFSLNKTADDDSIVGAEVTTNLHVGNGGNVAISNVVVSDPIPNEYNVTRVNTGSATSVEYQKNGDTATWIAGVPLGPSVAVASFPSFVGTDYVSALRFTLGTLGVASGADMVVYSTVINPPHGGASYALPHNVTNTATLSGQYKGTPLTDTSDGATTEISVPKARPTPQKNVLSGSPALPGKVVRYELRMFNGSFNQLDEPVIADLLPAEVDYVAGSSTITKNITGCAASPAFTQTANYNGSGRTLLKWSWAGTGCLIPTGDDARVVLDVRVKAGTYPTSGAGIANRFALVDYSTDPDLVRKNKCAVGSPDEPIFTGAGVDPVKLCFSPPSYMTVLAAASITSAKFVKGQLDSVFHRDPKVGSTVQGGLITYQMELANTGNVDFKDLEMVDVLPFDLPAPGNQGVRDLTVLGTKWTPQLAGPVVISPAIPGLTVRYATETNPCRPNLAPTNPSCTPMTDGVSPGPGIWSLNLPSDPTTVRALKFDFGTYVLTANAVLRFSFPMFAPDDAPIATAGSNGTLGDNDDTDVAWNTFAFEATRSDDGATLVAQPPRVGIEVQAASGGIASYGDYVWNDANQDGIQNEPAFRGINGVTVNLYSDADGDIATTGDQTLIGVKITANDSGGKPGYYVFPGLAPGNYFAEFVPPAGFGVSPRDISGDDAKDSDIDLVTFRSHVTTLVAGQDYRDTDAGFFAPVVSLGNRVWFDTNNDGLDNDGAGAALGSSTGIADVAVQLFLDANGDGKLTGAEQNWLAQQTTDANGFYTFTEQTHSGGAALGSPAPLFPAQYIVGVPSANFAAAGALVGYYSSGTTVSAAGAVSEVAAPDPDTGIDPVSAADDDRDRDDNGDTVRPTALIPSPFYGGGVLSKPIFVDTNEPTGEPESAGTAPGGLTITDNRSNLTLDFGFYTASFGNVVWNDNGAAGGTLADGLRNGAEPGLAGVTVQLFSGDNSTEINVGPDGVLGTADDAAGGATTDASGNYRFVVPQGQYRARVTVPAGYVSTRDTAGTSNPNSNVDSDDNGLGTSAGTVASNGVTITPGSAGALSHNVVNAAAGSTSDPTVDFGVVRTYSLGNRVWADQNNSGTLDGAEAGVGGVTLRLFGSDGTTRAKDIAGNNVPDATTDGNGYYRFDNLPAGDYIAEVQSGNFAGPLNGFVSSTGAGQQANPNTDAETDDNGLDAPVAGAIRSNAITLGEAPGTAEPTTDADGGPIASGEAPDNQSNRTLDFGFFEPLSIGNRVWDDVNNDGKLNGAEVGMPNVTVRLFRDTNNDDAPDGAALGSMLTNASGHYLFTMLQPGDYIVEIDAPAGYRTSTGYPNIPALSYEPAPDQDVNTADSDDNGSLVGAVIRSKTVTLTRGGEPTGEAATIGLADSARDNNSNIAVDFGLFKPLSIGNRVWRDANNNGTIDAADGATPGINGVLVRLYRDTNNDGAPDDADGSGSVTTADAIKLTTTDTSGFYLFADLGADTYVVDAVTPAGYTSSTGKTLPTPYETNVPDPDTNIDHDDSGATIGTVARSKPVTLALATEPTGEGAMAGYTDPATDDSANYTVDFGFYETLSLGNRIWLDADNSGAVNGTEAGLAVATTVRLYRDSNDDGTPDDLNGSGGVTTADAVRSMSSLAGSGSYLFTGLDEDTYIVEVDVPTGYRGSTGVANAYEPGPDADANPTDNDDNGAGATGTIRSQPVTLTLGGEPTGEPATTGIPDTTADNRSNVTVDFGLFRPVNLGNLIFEDGDNSGIYSGSADRPLAGATVSLFLGDGTTPARDVTGALVADQTTAVAGTYNFTNLPPGDYVVKVTAPTGYRGSTGVANAYEPGPDADTTVADNRDRGTGLGNVAVSLPVTLTSGGEPATGVDTDGADGNLTLDFGFWHPVSVGNLVFQDNDDNGSYNPAIDDEVQNASVSLFKSDGTTIAQDVNGANVPAQTTGASGLYSFTNLPPGDYIVKVTAPGSYRSSTDIASTGTPNGNADNDDNGPGTGASVTSAIITLTSGGEPNTPADEDDVHGNTTLDFGFVLPVSLGNLVWDDANNNAVVDGGEQPIPGASVSLFKSDGTTPAVDINGAAVASQTTLVNGLYSFTNLRPGAYVVRVTPPAGYLSSKDIAATTNPDGNADNDDNGVGTGTTAQSAAITLARTAEPTAPADEDDANGNTTLDFGFVRAYSLGNRVWFDADNSGARDAGEAGIQNVTVRLFKADGTTRATTVAGATVADATTDGSGYYRFDSLPPGDYIVEVQSTNFGASNPLNGMRSSTGALQRSDPNTNIDSDDNGLDTLVAGALRSGTVTLGEAPGTSEPTGDTDGGAIAAGEAADNQSNRTVDFGLFRPVNLGNLVFEDGDNNGLYSGSVDRPLAGATVSLFLGDGTTPARDLTGALVADQTTTGTGLYNFTNLSPGDYVVKVTAPGGYRSSTDIGTSLAPNGNVDNDDNGEGATQTVSSRLITLTSGGEPTGDGDGSDGNLTLDFGFFQPLHLGNLVWEDVANNGVFDAGTDTPLAGAAVSLFQSDGTTPAVDASGAAVASQTTTGTGLYLFTNLAPGQYVVKVTAPAGFRSSTDIGTSANPNNDTDNDDNGVGGSNAVASGLVTLSSHGEPDTAVDTDDTSGNLTVDFGFFQPLRLGNLVWEDVANNGVYDAGTDTPLAGAVVSLFQSDGTTPAVDASGAAVASQTTTGTGLYLFTNLAPGQYVVKVAAPTGFRSSTDIATSANPNNDTNNDDNGVGGSNAVASGLVTLSSHGEPDTAVDSDDTSGNLTVDFGFYHLLSLGNLVWDDAADNGVYDAGTDTPLAGATVSLFKADGTTPAVDADGATVADQTTLTNGLYRFTNLAPGQYVVKVAAPAGFRSSSDIGTSANPNNDTDNDDNGMGSSNAVASGLVTLSSHGEPDTGVDSDDTSGNLTVDFGFFQPLRLGNLVWEDANNNGTNDAGDTPLADAVVSLFKADGTTPAVDVDGAAVASQTTTGTGLYLFTNLAPAQYVVKVTAPTGFRSSTDIATSGNANNDTDNDDNGVGGSNAVASSVVTLASGTEPATGVDSDNVWGNLTVDFGFYTPLRLGNLVWEDANNSGTNDAGDTPLAGAVVSLFKSDGITPATDVDGAGVASQTTTGTGLYLFTNLLPGQYVVKVTAPTGFRSSTDIATSADPNNDTDDDDNGVGSANAVASNVVTLSSNGEPDEETDSDDTSGNLTVDFGFFHPLRLGNLVWEDVANNGVYDAGTDSPLAGAVVSLFAADGTTPAVDVDGAAVASQTTTGTGLYLFTNLLPGQYVVKVTAPTGFRSSTDIGTSGNPDNDTDDDDNGVGSANAVSSDLVTLVSRGEPATAVDSDDASGNLTVDFGFYQPLRLGNLVWEDANNSGKNDAGDAPLAGATVSLFAADGTTPAVDVDGAAVASQTTTGTGLYLFTNLLPGQYVVKVTAPTGFRSSTDIGTSANPNNDTDDDDNGVGSTNAVASNVVTLSSRGEPPVATDSDDTSGNLTVDFGFFQPLRLGNLVWEDADNNGIYNEGDDPLAGAVVSLFKSDGITPATDADGAAVASQTTTGTGLYLFTNLAPGQYVVKVAAPTGFRSSTDIATSGNPNNDTDDDDNGVGSGNAVASGLVTLASGSEPDAGVDTDNVWGNLTVDFGFYTPLRLGNLVWEDRANDGVYDPEFDMPLSGAVVSLFKSDGTTPATDVDGAAVVSQTTGVDGQYLFTNLVPGQYVVKVTAPTGFRSSTDIDTSADPDNDTDDDDNGLGNANAVASDLVTLVSRREPDEETDDDDISGNLTVDFGFFHPLRLGNLVWEDVANNGVYDAATDTPLAGATVSLFEADGTTPVTDVDGTAVASQTTTGTGLYLFTNLLPGQYVVKVTAPAGFRSSTDIATTPDANGDIDNDDNGEGSSNAVASRSVTLQSQGEPDTADDGDDTSGNLTVDFGFFHVLSLGNLVWEDFANNGVFDGADTPLAGATVVLFAADGTTPAVDADGQPVAPQTTGADGLYLFTNLLPGQYVVEVTAQEGYSSSTDIAGSLTPDNNTNGDDNGEGGLTSVASRPITLTSHGEPDTAADGDDADGNLTVDFGFFRPASLGDYVWLDLNRDGVQDKGENGVSGVVVTLYRPGPDNTPGTADDTAVLTTTTGLDGAYLFSRLGAGDYFVRFTLPPGFDHSPLAGSADSGEDSDADPATGRTVVITLDPGEDDPTWDAGIFFTASLGNRVWFDSDADGVQDAGEVGIEGVVVTLLTGNGTEVMTTTTDIGGFYAFSNLPPGDYRVVFTPPAGHVFSPTGGSPDADADSNADPTTGSTAVTTIAPGESDPTWDAGLYIPVRLGNLVWEDANNNGRVDTSEAGIAGVAVRLYRDANGDDQPDGATPLASTATDASGHYLFDNLVPGAYLVEIDPPAGYVTSTGRNGMATGAYEAAPDPDSNVDDDDNGTRAGATAVRSVSVLLLSADEPAAAVDSDDTSGNLTVDFGLFRPAALGSVVWYDRDGDGRHDPNELGAAGVTVTLYYADGSPVTDALGRPIQVVTGADGSFLFDNLVPGSYQIGVTNLPSGYVFTVPDMGSDDADSDVNPITGMSGAVTVGAGQQVLTIYAGLISPTSVTLVRFGAERVAGGVALSWETGAEFNTAGFRIYRSATGDAADAVLLTDALIVARGGPQSGASYRWLDTTADENASYSYWLEEQELGGGTARFGPAQVGAQTAAAKYTAFLPLVAR